MKLILRLVAAAAMVAVTFGASAQEVEWRDTVMIYSTWENLLDGYPDAVATNPLIEMYTPFDVYISSRDATMRKMFDEAAAVAIGDSIFLAGTGWLCERFSGDCHKMQDFVPLFFSSKIAFLQWTDGPTPSLLNALFGGEEEEYSYEDFMATADYYLIDFAQSRVERIDHKVLSRLLAPYRDLLMRYQGMKDYKKRPVISFFFNEYLRRIGNDPEIPHLIDIIAENGDY